MSEFSGRWGNWTIRTDGSSFIGRIIALVFGFVFGAILGLFFCIAMSLANINLPAGWVVLAFAIVCSLGLFRLTRRAKRVR